MRSRKEMTKSRHQARPFVPGKEQFRQQLMPNRLQEYTFTPQEAMA